MTANTKIEWADHTFNPWIGCTRVSPGCDHCYAAVSTPSRALKVKWGTGEPRRRTSADNWQEPLRWEAKAARFQEAHGRRQRVFCASLADVFDNEVDACWQAEVFDLIRDTPSLDWLVLTKRIGNAQRLIGGWDFANAFPNVSLGITVVNQAEADRDIPKLLAIPARVRFLSVEPLLGPVDLTDISDGHADSGIPRNFWTELDNDASPPGVGHNALTGVRWQRFGEWSQQGSRLDWVIAGGESGHHARPMHPDWVGSLRDQCDAAGVPLLFKQWGEWIPISQTPESFTDRLYKSNRRAKLHEDQAALDESYGRRCTVDAGVVHANGSLHRPLEPMAFLQGTGAMLTYKVGKKNAGRLLDGVTHDAFPEVA